MATKLEREIRACYDTLELPASATLDEVRESYRLLSRVWHPDRFAGNAELLAKATSRQQDLNAAYDRLVDAFARGLAPLGAAAPAGSNPLRDTAPGSTPLRETAPAGTRSDRAENAPPKAATRTAAWSRRFASLSHRQRLLLRLALVFSLLSLLFLALVVMRGTRAVRTRSGDRLHAAMMAVGGGHGCAGLDIRVYCWGRNEHGQRGDDAPERSTRAEALALRSTVTAVVAGLMHTCALLEDGSAWCWGGNFAGQLGDHSLSDRPSPSRVRIDEPITRISTLTWHTCALTLSNAIRCWGNDTDGQLGAGRAVASCRWDEQRFHCSDRPEPVRGAGPWRAVAAGGSHTCAIRDDGRAFCWGSNRSGQLGAATAQTCSGTGGTLPCRREPAPVTSIDAPLTSIAAGASHTCALDATGRTYCWGSNRQGQTGATDGDAHETPVALDTPLRFVSIAAGGYHTCGLTGGGALYCWGSDAHGELRGQARDRCNGVACARRPMRLARRGVRDVDATFGATCIRRRNGDVHCWGRGDPDVTPTPRTMPPSLRAARGLRGVGRELKWYASAVKRFVYRQAARLNGL